MNGTVTMYLYCFEFQSALLVLWRCLNLCYCCLLVRQSAALKVEFAIFRCIVVETRDTRNDVLVTALKQKGFIKVIDNSAPLAHVGGISVVFPTIVFKVAIFVLVAVVTDNFVNEASGWTGKVERSVKVVYGRGGGMKSLVHGSRSRTITCNITFFVFTPVGLFLR